MSRYDYEMEMCCSMQVSSLIHELELCKRVGDTTDSTVHPRYPAAPRDDTLFDCMNLYAKMDNEGKVELSGTVFYWNPVDGDSQKTVVIEHFPDIDACLEWLKSGGSTDLIASKL